MEKIHLHRQLPDLRVEIRSLPIEVPSVSARGIAVKHIGKAFLERRFPVRDLPRMHIELLGNLLDGFDSFDRLKGNPYFECGFVSSSFGFHQADFGLGFIPQNRLFYSLTPGPDFGVHLTVSFDSNKWTNVSALKVATKIKIVFEQKSNRDRSRSNPAALNVPTNRVESVWYPVREVLDEYYDTTSNYERQVYP